MKRCGGAAVIEHGWSSSGIGKKKAAYAASLWCFSLGTAMHLHDIERRAQFNDMKPDLFGCVIAKKNLCSN